MCLTDKLTDDVDTLITPQDLEAFKRPSSEVIQEADETVALGNESDQPTGDMGHHASVGRYG